MWQKLKILYCSCSGDYGNSRSCTPIQYLNCDGTHPLTSGDCSIFKFEQDTLEVPHNEFNILNIKL